MLSRLTWRTAGVGLGGACRHSLFCALRLWLCCAAGWVGGMQVAMLAARARALNERPPSDALRLVGYCSDQAHSSIKKAAMVG